MATTTSVACACAPPPRQGPVARALEERSSSSTRPAGGRRRLVRPQERQRHQSRARRDLASLPPATVAAPRTPAILLLRRPGPPRRRPPSAASSSSPLCFASWHTTAASTSSLVGLRPLLDAKTATPCPRGHQVLFGDLSKTRIHQDRSWISSSSSTAKRGFLPCSFWMRQVPVRKYVYMDKYRGTEDFCCVKSLSDNCWTTIPCIAPSTTTSSALQVQLWLPCTTIVDPRRPRGPRIIYGT